VSQTKVILFNANETLLDLVVLDPHFTRMFGDPAVRTVWFQQLLQLFLTATIIDEYVPFPVLAESALVMVAASRGVELDDQHKAAMLQAMLALPAHPDVRPALKLLRATSHRLAVLTNSTATSAAAQMTHAGLDGYFEAVLSADAVQRYKPAREAYLYAAHQLAVEPSEIRLIAAHGWDVAGALAAGCRAAFVGRKGKALNPRGKQPDIIGTGMHDVVSQIIQHDV